MRHERRDADRRAASRIVGDVDGHARRPTRTRRPSRGASTPTTTPSSPSRTRWRRSPPASATSRRRSTATASAAGNANMVSILANLALKTVARARPGGRRRPRRPDRAVALGRRDRQPRPRTTTSRTSGGRRSPTRAASTGRPSPRSSGATSTSTRRRSATRAGSSSPSSAAGPTPRSGPSSSASSSTASSTRASCRSSSSSSRPTASRSRAPRPASSSSSGATAATTSRRSGSSTTPASSSSGPGQELLAEATVKVEVDGEILHTAADGNGPVNALDAALRKALRAFYPDLDEVHLVDYKVRILDGEAATAARTRVVIDSIDGARDLVDDGQRHEHHRGVGGRPGRFARVRDLEGRRRSCGGATSATSPPTAARRDRSAPAARTTTATPRR